MTFVVVVGPDGTGKSTLVTELAERLGLEAVRFTQHSRPRDYLARLEQPVLNEVWDRFFFDEYIYGPIVRPGEPYRWSDNDRKTMTALFHSHDPFIIFGTRIVRPEDEYVTQEQNLRVAMAYGDMLASFPCPVLEYRAGVTSYDSVVEAIKKHEKISGHRGLLQRSTSTVPPRPGSASVSPASQ